MAFISSLFTYSLFIYISLTILLQRVGQVKIFNLIIINKNYRRIGTRQNWNKPRQLMAHFNVNLYQEQSRLIFLLGVSWRQQTLQRILSSISHLLRNLSKLLTQWSMSITSRDYEGSERRSRSKIQNRRYIFGTFQNFLDKLIEETFEKSVKNVIYFSIIKN